MTNRNPNAGPSSARYDWTIAVEMAASGATHAAISRAVGCSIQAVVGWAKRHGVTLPRRANMSTEEVYGCPREVARALNGGLSLGTPGAPAFMFSCARRNASRRNVSWEMTFPEWVALWDAAGGLALRGRSSGDLCMARHGDVGPYRVGNVSIITTRQNVLDSFVNISRRKPSKPARAGYGRGYFLSKRSTKLPYVVNARRRYIGSFATEAEAVAAYRAAIALNENVGT